jgi:hypothetical protein
MNNLLRIVGFGLMIGGAVLVLIWAIEPFRIVWPWLLQLPILIRIGVVAGTLGLAILMGTLISERIRNRDADRDLRDDF